MAVAVVHDDAVLFTDGFGVREIGAPRASTPTRSSSWPRSPNPLRPRWSPRSLPTAPSPGRAGWPTSLPGFALHDAWPTQNVSLADLFSHRSGLPDHAGDVLEDLGFDREPGSPSPALPGAGVQLPRGLRLHQLRSDRGRGRRGEGGRESWEDLSRGAALSAAGHGADQLALCRLHGRAQPRHPARQGRRSWVVTPHAARPGCRSPRRVASAQRHAIWRSGCGCNSGRGASRGSN